MNHHLLEPLINCLPVELLQKIFLLILNDDPENPSIFSCGDTHITVDVTSPPLLLTRVCRLWRDVAHSTTEIWSRIHVVLSGRVKPLKPFLPSLLEVWLARSGHRPLSLSIVSDESSQSYSCGMGWREMRWLHPSKSRADRQLLEILLSAKGRWESVAIKSPASDICEWGDSIIDTPRLRTLTCFREEFRRINAPNLHRLHIVNRIIDFPAAPTCKNIRYLRLQHTSVNAIRFALVIFPQLENMVLDDYTLGYGGRIDMVTHSRLRSMTLPITFADRIDFFCIFHEVRLPMLQKLTLVVEELDSESLELECVRMALAWAGAVTYDELTVDLQMATPPSEVDLDIVEPLFKVTKEVTVCGKVYFRRL